MVNIILLINYKYGISHIKVFLTRDAGLDLPHTARSRLSYERTQFTLFPLITQQTHSHARLLTYNELAPSLRSLSFIHIFSFLCTFFLRQKKGRALKICPVGKFSEEPGCRGGRKAAQKYNRMDFVTHRAYAAWGPKSSGSHIFGVCHRAAKVLY